MVTNADQKYLQHKENKMQDALLDKTHFPLKCLPIWINLSFNKHLYSTYCVLDTMSSTFLFLIYQNSQSDQELAHIIGFFFLYFNTTSHRIV